VSEVYQLLSQAFIRLDIGDQQLMRKFGLTLTQSWALVHIAEADGRSLSELASLLICDKSNVTSIVDKLEADGLAVRKRGKDGDRRYTRVILTAQGHILRNTIMAARSCMLQERLGKLNEQECMELHHSLARLAHVLTTQLETQEETAIIEYAYQQSQVYAENAVNTVTTTHGGATAAKQPVPLASDA
jgi:DNA-binding MarR family transcriptional regulator